MSDNASPDVDENPLSRLTEKQREVLDLVMEHKTSKEIARLLGISPHTVDQRVTQARAKLRLHNRGEVASEYRRLKTLYEGETYQFSYLEKNAYLTDSLLGTAEDAKPTQPLLFDAADRPNGDPLLDYRVGSELFEGRWGTLARVMAILVIALFLLFVVMGGVGMFVTLSHLSGR